jgi:hypothetical protein
MDPTMHRFLAAAKTDDDVRRATEARRAAGARGTSDRSRAPRRPRRLVLAFARIGSYF